MQIKIVLSIASSQNGDELWQHVFFKSSQCKARYILSLDALNKDTSSKNAIREVALE